MYISHFPFYKLLQFYAFVHCFEVNTYICLILSYLNDYLYDFSTINLILCAGNHLYDYGQVISKPYIYMFIVLLLYNCDYSVHSKIVFSSLLVEKQHLMKYTTSFELFVNYINKIFM